MTLPTPTTTAAVHQTAPGPLRSRFGLDLRSLAAFRIAAGLILLADALLRCRDFSLMFTPAGMFPHEALHAFHPSIGNWSLAFLIDAAWWDASLLALEGSAGLLLAVGYQTRLVTLVAWVALVSIIRRTAPATNAGDLWLATLLLWGFFLPLGTRWSLDGRRKGPPTASAAYTSVAAAALTLQILVVYLAAGLSKWNTTWLTGDAVRDALSIHDHGTPLGAWLVELPGVAMAAGLGVLALELGGPAVFLLCPRPPRLRCLIVLAFMSFHAAVAVLMTVGLFSSIGIAAWLALVPGPAWDWLFRQRLSPLRHRSPEVSLGPRALEASLPEPSAHPARTWLLNASAAALLGLAITDATAKLLPSPVPLPASLRTAVDLACLPQDWEMFGTVLRQEQWAYARGVLVNGDEVDLLRDGRPLQRERPHGGFHSLRHHRWHKLLWNLPKPTMRVFSPSVAAALANDWNAHHPAERQVRRLEICFARLSATTGPGVTEPGVLHELVVASWPPRDARGAGNLDRWLEEHDAAGPSP